MKNFIQPGDSLTIVAPATATSGLPVIAGTIIGVAQHDAASGAQVTILRKGVFSLPKTGSQAWTVGAAIYWTGTACTTTVGSNTLIGSAVAAVGSGAGETTGIVLFP